MKGWYKKGGWTIGGLLTASSLILFFNLWARSLENHDYLRYAEVTREMIRSGDWIVPHLNGEIYLDKPPLLFWFMAIPSTLYGSVTPLIARLPCALSAWIGVLLLFLWGREIYGTTQSGLISGGILLSSYQYFFQARMAKTDMILCILILLSLYFFHIGYHGVKGKSYLSYGLSFFFMGLGVLTKGPFGLIPLPIILIFLIKEGRWRIWIGREFLMGYAILLLTILPWPLLFIKRLGWEKSIELVKGTQILTRKAPVYFYFIQIWVQFFPWSLLLPILFIYLCRRKGEVWKSRESIFLIWFMTIFILLTLFQYRVSRYLLSALPPLALMIGGMWKKKIFFFLIPFLFFILLWHSVNMHWILKDSYHSQGKILTEELKPFLKGSALFGFQLDQSTKEEINFYLDPLVPIPMLKDSESLFEQLKRGEKELVLMPIEVFAKVRNQDESLIMLVKEFQYKKGKLVLISNRGKRNRSSTHTPFRQQG